jgi:hypothetical protein
MRLKTGRIEKPLTLAVGLGLVAGVVAWGGPHFYASTDYPSELDNILSAVGAILGLLVFPGIISLAARKHSFWWGFVPACVCVAFAQFADFAFAHDFPIVRLLYDCLTTDIEMILVCVLLSSGPVSLICYIVQRRRGQTSTLEDTSPEVIAKEGAWPPPPAVK